MIKDIYPYAQIGEGLLFAFVSEGINGDIYKLIAFTPTNDGKWNLGFGDWQDDGAVEDRVMTNNQDVVKVIGTVAKVTYDFFKKYPDAIVVVRPVDEKRKKLYNIVFQRHYAFINQDFHIIAEKDDVAEVYSPVEIYDRFELFLKSK
jgi:hypothetical protein